MNHVRSLFFESLEGRRLLSNAHVNAAHAKPAVVATPLVLSGTLTVDNKAASTVMNEDGSTTTSIPVSGANGYLPESTAFGTRPPTSTATTKGPTHHTTTWCQGNGCHRIQPRESRTRIP